MRTRRLAFFVFDGFRLIDATGPLEAFGTANLIAERELYRITIASPDGADVTCGSGVKLGVDANAGEVEGAIDLLVVPGTVAWERVREDEAILDSLGDLAARSDRIASVCAGSLLLAAIGLLDGRRASTHWELTEELAARHPEVEVLGDRIFVEDGRIYTAAGGTAGIDLALAIIEDELGAELARRVARFLVVFMQRSGGQAQFSTRMRFEPSGPNSLRPLLDAIAEDPSADHRLAALSRRAGFSERHLGRVFKREVGITPARYVEAIRLEAARGMLESSDAPLATIARESGLSTAETMRRTFAREIGVTPEAYRRGFRTTGAALAR